MDAGRPAGHLVGLTGGQVGGQACWRMGEQVEDSLVYNIDKT